MQPLGSGSFQLPVRDTGPTSIQASAIVIECIIRAREMQSPAPRDALPCNPTVPINKTGQTFEEKKVVKCRENAQKVLPSADNGHHDSCGEHSRYRLSLGKSYLEFVIN